MQKMVSAAEGATALQLVQNAVLLVVGCPALGPEAAVWGRSSTQCLGCVCCHCIALN